MFRVCVMVLLTICSPVAVRAMNCNQAMAAAVSFVQLPGEPFTSIASRDGCWLFTSLTHSLIGTAPGVAVLSRHDGRIALERVAPLSGLPSGMTLTHDGQLLIVTSVLNVAFVDVARLTARDANPVRGYYADKGPQAGQVYTAVTPDDRHLLVSNEWTKSISVFDLAQIRATNFANIAPIGTIAIGGAPVGLALSNDGRHLFAAIESMDAAGWPVRCSPEQRSTAVPNHAEGAIVVIDINLAITKPETAIVNTVKAGCSPVRVVAAPGGRVFVTARGSDALLMFDEEQLTGSFGMDFLIPHVAVGPAPVGVNLIADGHQIVVANSNRFSGGSVGQSLWVIDTSKVDGSGWKLGMIQAKEFPREINSTSDGRTLLITNAMGHALEVVDLVRSPWLQAAPEAAQSNGAASASPANQKGGSNLLGRFRMDPRPFTAVCKRKARDDSEYQRCRKNRLA
jgi:DNA-binding beta-propeller fold protein YncE